MTPAEVELHRAIQRTAPGWQEWNQRLRSLFDALAHVVEQALRKIVAAFTAIFPPRPPRRLSAAAARFEAKYEAGRWRGQRKKTKALRRLRRAMEAG